MGSPRPTSALEPRHPATAAWRRRRAIATRPIATWATSALPAADLMRSAILLLHFLDVERLVDVERARVERALGADRMGVIHVHVARAHVHAVQRMEPEALGFGAEERPLVLRHAARITAGSPELAELAFADRRHAGAAERLVVGADR